MPKITQLSYSEIEVRKGTEGYDNYDLKTNLTNCI